MIEKLEENEKLLADQVGFLKQVESKDKKIKKLQTELNLINTQTFQLMQKLSTECLEDDQEIMKVVSNSSSRKSKSKKPDNDDPSQQSNPLDVDDLKTQFDKLDPKTIALSAHTIEHVNSTVNFLTCENSTLQ